MSDLVFHPSVRDIVASYRRELPHSVLLTGLQGIGLLTTARYLASSASEIHVIEPQLLSKTSSTKQISVEMVRTLYELARTKSSEARVIIIDDADTMTVAAQNAFLKLLEEPNDSTKFILTSHHPEQLLPTVRSRLQSLQLPPLGDEATRDFLTTLAISDPRKQAQLLFVAPGLPAELTRLTASNDYFDAMAARVKQARNLLESTNYKRLAMLMSEVGTDRSRAIELIDQLIRLLSMKPSPQSITTIDRLLTARDRIAGGGSIRLQLAAAVL